MIKDDFFTGKRNRRISRVVNGVWALRVGFGCLVVIVYGSPLYFSCLNDILFKGQEFRRWDFILMHRPVVIYVGMTYILFRIGYEELKNERKTNGHSHRL